MDKYSGLCSTTMWELFLQVWDMDNDYLVEEVLGLDYTKHDDIKHIVTIYMLSGKVSDENREKLIGFYILSWHDEEEED